MTVRDQRSVNMMTVRDLCAQACMVVAASAMRVLAVDSSAGSAVTGFVGMVSCGECNYKAQTQSVDGQWLSVGSVPFSMGRSVFLRAASTFMSATTLLAKLITKSIWVLIGKEE